MFRSWFRTALVNLLIAASLGAVLRFAFVAEIPGMNFRYVLHAHSHAAMLGWVYLALYACMARTFLPDEKARARRYRRLFTLTQLSVAGMLLSFPFQGYGPVSIVFSTAHILLSYGFAWYFIRDLPRDGGSLSILFIRASLGFMIFSTLGVWAMGPIMTLGLRSSPLYVLVVQFFLHFQFFGWFLFAAIGLYLRRLEQNGILWPEAPGRRFFLLTLMSTVLTFALPLTWWKPAPSLFLLDGIGVLLTAAAAYHFVRGIWSERKALIAKAPYGANLLFRVALAAYVAMALLRLATIIPAVAVMGYTLRNFTIGFLHLFLLGAVTPFLFAFFIAEGNLSLQAPGARLGVRLFLTGMILSEVLLFGQGVLLWIGAGFISYYYETLFLISLLMPAGVLVMINTGFHPGRE